ncbi:hypothetical protein [Pseudodesulfovibrio sediminis]|uniref:Nucleoside transporter/FeoB GTPase Gate domain-containing protein n=1 Tax=Pseudodesulfovibrio sediminis TaxID=2810563 RepID=A0ABM7P3Y8_9BACT|nr:hypothetical protein [Pseudodesulfovibrio sediminis]BCS87557.1 hypothetical protein PSDVSF_07990 [Pseudodesulfovibrio sediminis]
MNKIYDFTKTLLIDAIKACYELFKVMIPVIIGVKILQELDLIQYLAWPLKPFMGMLGLPAELGLAWASAMVNSMYAGLIVFLSLIQDLSITTEQATVFSVIILIGHGFPIEGIIARKAGARMIFQVLIRAVGAFVLGFILHQIYSTTGTLQGPALIALQTTSQPDPTLLQWATGKAMNLLSIFGIVLGLMLVMRILHAIRAVELMNMILQPILKIIGIGPKASAITIIGLTLGLSYGGGLIIAEAKSGNVGRKDIFYSLTLMGLCHSLIEDTLLVMLIGAHLSGVFWGRFLFGLVVLTILVQLTKHIPTSFSNRFLWGDPKPSTT